jgi:hypothetical protein
MTALLSRVAKCMGWGRVFDAVMDGDKYICLRKNMKFDNTPIGHWLSHLLVEKMVGDGYEVELKIHKFNGITVSAFKTKYDKNERAYSDYHKTNQDTVPAAILALFVKVYSL